MIQSFLHILAGYRTVSVSGEYAAQALNLLHTHNQAHWNIRSTKEGGITFRINASDAATLQKKCDAENVPIALGQTKGFPALWQRYKHRWGILFGAVIFAVITAISCSVVWEVQISGNQTMEEKEIVRMLSDYGFGVGSFFKKIDFDVLQNEFLLTTNDIAWISVNMVGTVAHVQVRENLGGKAPGGAADGIANVVAAEDGQITEVQIRAGKAAVGVNDVVRRGDLLISGVIAVGEDGLRYEHAEGAVLARVNRLITVEIPKNGQRKVYTGEENVKKNIIFFGKEIKLFGKSSIDNPTYDTILSEKSISLPGGAVLPVLLREVKERAYSMEPYLLTDSEAYVEAMKEYRSELDTLLCEAEVLSASVEHYSDEQVYRITAHLVCMTDIAATAPIEPS